MSEPVSILVVVASPEERSGTPMLRQLLDEMSRRPGVTVHVWMLRAYRGETPWPGARVIDRLRTWWPARLFEMVGLTRAADALRGARLRWWRYLDRPDGVLLDDGLGQRLFPESLLKGPNRPALIERKNDTLPRFADWEPDPVVEPDVVLYTDCEPEVGRDVEAVVVERTLGDFREFRRRGDPEEVGKIRERLGIDGDGPLVCGWGDEAWIDGTDMFVRALWVLEHRHGITARGVWFGLAADPNAVDRLRAEAERCGVGDRFFVHPRNDPLVKFCGDVAFLPYRSPLDPREVREAVASGLGFVTYDGLVPAASGATLVPYLDVDAAGAEIATLSKVDRRAALQAAAARIDAWGLADFIIRKSRERR